jgi:uncharacterized protein (TIGR03437 family)
MLSGKAVFALVFACGITSAQTPAVQSIVNAASLRTELSPGTMAVVQGSGFASDAVLRLGGAVLTPTPGSVLPSRFNVYLPGDLAPGTYQATVSTRAGQSSAVALTLVTASPAFYDGAFFDDTFSRLSVEKGAPPNKIVTAYANGLGPANGKPPVVSAQLPLRVSIKGDDGAWQSVPATAAQDSSLAGYWQVRFTMPGGMTQGPHDAYLSAGTVDGPTVALPAGGAIIAAMVNAASNAKGAPVAPGSLAAIYGTELTPSDGSNLFPATTLPGGGQIRIAGVAAPLAYASATFGQAAVVVPWEVAPSDGAEVVIENSFGRSRAYKLRVAETAVGIFRLNDPSNPDRQNAAALIRGTVWAAIPPSMASALKIPQNCRAAVDADRECGQPASEGDVLQVYVTGLGKVSPELATGRAAPADGSVLHRAVATPQVTLGGVPATVLFAGLAPGFAGLYQLDVVVPKGVAPGDDVPLAIAMPAGDRDQATIAVRRSVARDNGVDGEAPEVDAALHAPTVFDALPPQPRDHVETADAVVAEDNERRRGRFCAEIFEVFRDGVHRDQLGGLEAGGVELEGLADVDEGEFLAGVEAAFDLLNGDFHLRSIACEGNTVAVS